MTNSTADLNLVKQYLSTHFQMSVSTVGDFPWIFTAYYAADKDLTLYFLTSPDTIHGKQIAFNPKVAIAIADSPQNPTSHKSGLQISGICTQLISGVEVKAGLELWRSALKVDNPNYTYEGMKSGKIQGRMFKIIPNKIKFFNEALQEEGKEKLIEL